MCSPSCLTCSALTVRLVAAVSVLVRALKYSFQYFCSVFRVLLALSFTPCSGELDWLAVSAAALVYNMQTDAGAPDRGIRLLAG